MAAIEDVSYYSPIDAVIPVSGNTAFGYYDDDSFFQTNGISFARFAFLKLGGYINQIELKATHYYTALEDAVTVYGKELYEYKIRENYLSFEGNTTGSNLNTSLIQPNFGNIIRISEEYGNEVGSGGNVNYYTGSIDLVSGQQFYDLNVWASASASLTAGDSIEVKRVFYEAPPAIIRYFDPYAGTGTGMQSLMETFGFGQFSPGINFMLMPIYFDVQKIQAIEFNDQIRRSAYSFELVNNQLRVFPIPTFDRVLWFNYIKKSERNAIVKDDRNNLITNISNVPYTRVNYSQINGPGIKWINDYALANVKETLGIIRSKYGSIPVPNSEVTLNGQVLVDEATNEKQALIEQLRSTLEDTSRKVQMQKKAEEASAMRDTFTNIPLPIYIK